MKKAPDFFLDFLLCNISRIRYSTNGVLAGGIQNCVPILTFGEIKILHRLHKGCSIFVFCFFLLVANNGKAQFTRNFSPIAFSVNGLTATGGNTIIINGKSKCLIVASGISSLNIVNNGSGIFNTVCKEVSPIANVTNTSVSMMLYPNPAVSAAKIVFTGQIDENLSCQIRIINMDGKLVLNKLVLMKEVQAGYMFNAAIYPAGTYLVSVEFMNKLYTMKLIKL